MFALLATIMNLIKYVFTADPQDTIDLLSLARPICGLGFFKPVSFSQIQQSVHTSLLFTFLTAFRKVIRDPEKVCFVPFHFDLHEVEAMLKAKAVEDARRARGRPRRCCQRARDSLARVSDRVLGEV